jgi:hypothetical protein
MLYFNKEYTMELVKLACTLNAVDLERRRRSHYITKPFFVNVAEI